MSKQADVNPNGSKANGVPDHTEGIYQHSKRPGWGLAILAWEKGDKRGYQFDDGTLRILKKGFYKMMTEVDPPDGEATELVEELNRRLKETIELQEQKANSAPLEPVYSFDKQLEIFRIMYPGGFHDPTWVDKVRGQGANKRLKRHRDSAIVEAQELFAKDRLELALAESRWADVVEDAIALLNHSNLVGHRDIDRLKWLNTGHNRAFAEALTTLLYGEEKYPRRFGTWVRMLQMATGQRPSWRFATAIPALAQPDNHVCVRYSVFKKQAAEVAPSLMYSKRARRRSYKSYRKVARATRRRLAAEGFQPRDYLDIHDFIWATLRPAAAKHLQK